MDKNIHDKNIYEISFEKVHSFFFIFYERYLLVEYSGAEQEFSTNGSLERGRSSVETGP